MLVVLNESIALMLYHQEVAILHYWTVALHTSSYCHDGKLAWFDLSTQMVNELGYNVQSLHESRIVIYKESTLPLG
jgi:hypothetical protein